MAEAPAAPTENASPPEDFGTFLHNMRYLMSLKDPPIHIRLLRHPPIRTCADAVEQQQVTLRSGAKAMLVNQRKTDQYTLIVLPADLSCDLKKIAAALGIANSKIRIADESEMQKVTGCLPGAVPPFGSLFPIPVKTIIDPKMATSTCHPPSYKIHPDVKHFATTDPEWPQELGNVPYTEFPDDNRNDCINFNLGVRTVTCAITYDDYLRILGAGNYSICDISK